MELKEKVNENLKKLKEDTLEIVKVVFELNSLIMEMPFTDKPSKKVKKNLTEKCRVVYDKCDNNLREVHQFGDLLKRKECNEYVVQLNVYLNALCTFMHVVHGYISNYSYKYKPDNDIEAIYNYYQIIMRKVDTFSQEHKKCIRDLEEEYYTFD